MGTKLIKGTDFFDAILEKVDDEVLELDDLLVDVAIQLIRARKAKGWTQLEAATNSHVKQAMISKLESGEYNPSIITLWKYAKSLDARCRISVMPQNVRTRIIAKPLSKMDASLERDCEFDEELNGNDNCALIGSSSPTEWRKVDAI